MRIALVAVSALALGLATQAAAQAAASDDPYVWLEDKDGARAMQWVEAQNAKTLPRLDHDPRYAGFYKSAYAISAATDRIPYPELTYGRVLNFWRDDAHPHGLWRWTTPADYATNSPHWTTLIDIDALNKAEGKTWVWKGATCIKPDQRLCMVALSDGGEDAVSYREYDLQTGAFVTDGFALPKSKQDISWLDKDTLLVARNWGAGTMTASGYPFVLKIWKRGQPLDQAKEVFRGAATDQVGSGAGVLSDAQGHRLTLITRGTTFFGHQSYVLGPKGAIKLPIPDKADILGMLDGHVVIRTSEDWTTAGQTIPAGALVTVDYRQLDGGPLHPSLLFQPTARQSINDVAVTRDHVILTILDNVRGRAMILTPGRGGWTSQPLALPDNATISNATWNENGNDAYLEVTGFLTPTTLWSLDAATGKLGQVKALPARFDASQDVVEQFEASSTDGTKIPYFIVHRKGIPLDGTTPTIMTAYGGFEISETPYYSGAIGKLWIEHGGSFVLANIRGGGEFGPAWHEAGRKTKRQIIYDDFAAVAKDIFARKLSSPPKFGIFGGSNGGLLMGVEFNQHPDLWHAVTIEVPLLDMIRYEKIEAGASWVDEYGSVSVPAEKAFLETISPYANLKKGGAYPEPFIVTTTKDDRVGPQHARKFAARMQEYGLPYLFYEDTLGGHSSDADIAQGARMTSLMMVYFSQKLMNPMGSTEGSAVTATK
ncbi:prolyl oligopeptidase family serine peptidase [Sphingomonas abietis]|uniref:Prolyl oligopeptidase family serine peptidase n=1 Tax=Sphingomonas abietis TaxID=3012344 RepID=A0ABY7NGY3_9SPHN|nr:prolyl oligopeptidase family serine peptidase [Sphingomonas abietis]WBO20783.1 prolyl oligopeptidase family serine peptidase [Sphingomonas abietis]